MPLNPTYSAGTVSVTAGGTTVTGNLTLWLAAGIREGDVFECRGLTSTIASVNSSTSITLVRPWFGATVTGSEYEIRYIADASRVIGAARTVVERFEASQPLFDGAYASYENLLDIVQTLSPTVRAIKAVVGGTETNWVRNVAGTALGGGWSPAAVPTPQNYGGANGASLAAAVAGNPNGTVRINYDERNIPADFAGVLLEYTKRAGVRNYTQTGFSVNTAQRLLRGMTGAHAGRTESIDHVELLANGSTANGPTNASVARSTLITKRGYASGSAIAGEIDAEEVFLRQDGPDGLPSGDPGSSDAVLLMHNAQNVGTCGFLGLYEGSVSNLQRTAGFPIDISMQIQFGIIDANNIAGKVAYGFAPIMSRGQGRAAFYTSANAGNGASWQYAFQALGRVQITWDGAYQVPTPDWAGGALTIARGRGINDATTITHRGTGALVLLANESSAIQFGVSGVIRALFNNVGSFIPASGQTVNVGDPSRRWAFGYFTGLDASGPSISLSGLPTHANNAAASGAGLAAGRVYRTATGELRIVI